METGIFVGLLGLWALVCSRPIVRLVALARSQRLK